MPFAGRVSVVIDDAAGRRVRNLVSARDFPEGFQRLEWDGYAEDGTAVSGGVYRVRAVMHRPLRYRYLSTLANGGEPKVGPWGPDHTPFRELVRNDDGTFTAHADLGESGPAVVTMDARTGRVVRSERRRSKTIPAEISVQAKRDREYRAAEAKAFLAKRTVAPYVGPWRRDVLVNPTSYLVLEPDRLWVTEDRLNPQRLTCWNLKTGALLVEKLGSARYGAPGGGKFPGRGRRWIAQDALWRLDPDRGEEELLGSLSDGSVSSRCYDIFEADGRIYAWGFLRRTTLYEFDGSSLAPVLEFATQNGIHYGEKWRPDGDIGQLVMISEGGSVTQFFPRASFAAAAGWCFQPRASLAFTIPVAENGEVSLAHFAPPYDLNRIWRERRRVKTGLPAGQAVPPVAAAFNDRFGRAITYDTEPYMICWNAEGEREWYRKNPYPGVSGAQKAPLPETGVLQGVLFPAGVAKLSETAEVAALVNDHGRVFFLTTDGILLDELFTDCRVSARDDETFLGGEPFGGWFGYDEDGERYLLQAGFGGMRFYEIEGLDTIRETVSEITVTDAALAEARQASDARTERKTSGKAFASIGGGDFGDVPVAAWKSGFGDVQVFAYTDAKALHLRWKVRDPSPWVNNGEDSFTMFKTGDAVDFSFRGAEGTPERLLISPRAGEPEETSVVWYRHEAQGSPHDFSSPWRTYTVGDVRFPDDIPVAVRRGNGEYEVDAAVPLAYFRGGDADFGVIFGDEAGSVNRARSYWSNKETGLVSDLPGEIIPEPRKWGTIRLERISRHPDWTTLRFVGHAGGPAQPWKSTKCPAEYPLEHPGKNRLNLLDYLPDGSLVAVTNERYLVKFANRDGTWIPEGDPVALFGDRDISMRYGRVLGDRIVSMGYGSVKFLDAQTLLPAPGLVYGGASGFVLSHVKMNAEMHGIDAEREADGSYVFLLPDGVIYRMRLDAASGRLVETNRIGPVPPAGCFTLTWNGRIVSGPRVFDFTAAEDAPPLAVHTLRREAGGGVLPDGVTGVYADRSLDLRVEKFGLNRGDIAFDIPRSPYEIDFQPWLDPDPALSRIVDTGDGFFALECYAADGRGVRFRLNREGRRRGDPVAVERDPEELRRESLCSHAEGITATVDPESGTLTVVDDASGGTLYFRDGLDCPTRVAIANGRIAVRERTRISKYSVKEEK
ncbi:MAG: hypothetical protein ACOX5G_04740 [Kiritimatiellia bacterium]